MRKIVEKKKRNNYYNTRKGTNSSYGFAIAASIAGISLLAFSFNFFKPTTNKNKK
jgi:hypothetical protein